MQLLAMGFGAVESTGSTALSCLSCAAGAADVLPVLQMFFLDPSLHCAPNDEMVVDFEMRRKERNHRLMHVRMVHHVEGPSASAQYGAANKRTSVYSIE
jgi:hypothetical protein